MKNYIIYFLILVVIVGGLSACHKSYEPTSTPEAGNVGNVEDAATDETKPATADCDIAIFDAPFWEDFSTVSPNEDGEIFAVDFTGSKFAVTKVKDSGNKIVTIVFGCRDDSIRALIDRVIAIEDTSNIVKTTVKFSPVVNPDNDLQVAEFDEHGKLRIGDAGIRRMVIDPVPVLFFDEEKNLLFVGNMIGTDSGRPSNSPIPPGAVEVTEE